MRPLARDGRQRLIGTARRHPPRRSMQGKNWILTGAALCGLAVVLGAFGAHELRPRLEASGHLDDWRTAVRYQAWHGLALLALAPSLPGRPGAAPVLPLFLIGATAFSGSLYGLALDGPGAILGPVTPLGGLLLIAGWCAVALAAFRSRN